MQRLFWREKSLNGLYVQNTPRNDFSLGNKICSRTDQNFGIIKIFHFGYYHITRMALYYR